MIRRSVRLLALGAVATACASMLAPSAQAEDFLSALFGAFGARPRLPSIPLPFANQGDAMSGPQARPRYAGGQAYCVRTCDGRYFPISASDNQSRAASCNSFCPASETKVVVLAKNAAHLEARGALSAGTSAARAAAVPVRSAAPVRSSGREAMNVSASSIY